MYVTKFSLSVSDYEMSKMNSVDLRQVGLKNRHSLYN